MRLCYELFMTRLLTVLPAGLLRQRHFAIFITRPHGDIPHEVHDLLGGRLAIVCRNDGIHELHGSVFAVLEVILERLGRSAELFSLIGVLV